MSEDRPIKKVCVKYARKCMKQQYYAVCSLVVADGICPLRVSKYVWVSETIHFLTHNEHRLHYQLFRKLADHRTIFYKRLRWHVWVSILGLAHDQLCSVLLPVSLLSEPSVNKPMKWYPYFFLVHWYNILSSSLAACNTKHSVSLHAYGNKGNYCLWCR